VGAPRTGLNLMVKQRIPQIHWLCFSDLFLRRILRFKLDRQQHYAIKRTIFFLFIKEKLVILINCNAELKSRLKNCVTNHF
jgi:hypothetical protein